MGTVFDLILIATVLGIIAYNYYRGLFRMIKSFKFLTAFLLGLQLRSAPEVKTLIGRFMNFDKFRVTLRERLDAMWGDKLMAAANADVASEEERFEGVFGFLSNKLTSITEYCREAFASGAEDFTNNVLTYATDVIESFILQLIGFVIVFAAAFIVLTLLCWVLTFIFDHGIFKLVNRLLGAVAGLIFGLCFAWVLSLVFVNIAPLVFSVEAEAVTNGAIGVVRWFHNDFILSELFGLSKI